MRLSDMWLSVALVINGDHFFDMCVRLLNPPNYLQTKFLSIDRSIFHNMQKNVCVAFFSLIIQQMKEIIRVYKVYKSYVCEHKKFPFKTEPTKPSHLNGERYATQTNAIELISCVEIHVKTKTN